MPIAVSASICRCQFGAIPLPVIATPKTVLSTCLPVISPPDILSLTNGGSFGMCMSPSNPQFIAATAANFGIPTPVPCKIIPVTPLWAPSKITVFANKLPVCKTGDFIMCVFGKISIELSLAPFVN